ncbi:peptidase C14 caspase catalytic subunit p20 (plasmid) [Nostoc carneum NIES-2107]|nr:peptidase C14 caspase catalytic subunit p20 [Nostoc carneum NIES-2107]
MREQTSSNPQLYVLLIGIDCYLPNQLVNGIYYPSLRGCVRDINQVEQFLKRLPNAPRQIFKLTASHPDALTLDEQPKPKEPAQQWPTYKNIVAKFQQLTQTAAPGDLVYIHYSGHGGRAKTHYPQLKGDRGIDETLVPTDIGFGEGQYLRDLELAALLKKMVDKGLIVTIVLDCCHSGGALRGEDADIRGLDNIDETPRPTTSLVASALELTNTWLSLTTVTTRKATAVTGILPEPKGYVLIAACRPSEVAYEYAFDGKQRNGALTYWLLDTLNQPIPGMTYRMLHDRINAKIHSQFPQQTPMLLGEGDRLVLGTDYLQSEYATTVMQVKVEAGITKVLLDAGQAQGIRKGAEFAIYPLYCNNFRKAEQRLALVEITQLGATEAWAEVKTLLNDKLAIAQGAKALLTSASVNLVRKVRLLADRDLSAEKSTALAAIEAAINGNGWLELVGNAEAADYQVDVKKITSATEAEKYLVAVNEVVYEICDRTGSPIFLKPTLKVGETNAANAVVKRLVHLAKYQAIQELDNHDISSPLRAKVVVELLGKQQDYDPVDYPQPEPFADLNNPEVAAGEYIFLKIRNDYYDVLNFTVLDLQSDWAINQIYPETSEFISLDPGQEELIPLRMSLSPGEKEGEDIFKVFATIGATNFRWLELPPLNQAIPLLEAKGIPRSGNPLEELLMAIAAEQPPMRNANPIAFPSREWTTMQVQLTVKTY